MFQITRNVGEPGLRGAHLAAERQRLLEAEVGVVGGMTQCVHHQHLHPAHLLEAGLRHLAAIGQVGEPAPQAESQDIHHSMFEGNRDDLQPLQIKGLPGHHFP